MRRALTAKRERAVHQERERRWRIHDEERRRQDQEHHSEELRRRRLRVLASRWVQHQRVSQFVTSVEQRVRDRRLDGEPQEVATRWVEWAKSHLRESDPVETLLNEPWSAAQMPPAMPMPWSWE